MTLNLERARQYLRSFNLRALFIQDLGWDRPAADVTIRLDDRDLVLQAVAEKRGVAILLCPPNTDGTLPDRAQRRKVDFQVAKAVFEHLILFSDGSHTHLLLQWVRRQRNKPITSREVVFIAGQKEEAFLQRLQQIGFTLDEEEGLTIVRVTDLIGHALDIEKVTKRFYERFKAEHDAFMTFLKGIPEEGMQRWYISVTLNRLMFVYFIQKKQFLNHDPDYLRTKLLANQKARDVDRYYLDFLCPLFFRGFAVPENERTSETRRLLGEVPYLNGGIFGKHQLEERYGQTIRIADAAFERLFDFFDAYQWHLDERPLKQDNEINPDVLGYIFEKYINQKQMGAYYTKEDITGYISQYTILPRLLDETSKACRVAFEGEHSVWRLLQEDPDRYIYPAVRKGVELKLPPEIALGLDTSQPNLIERRKGWNRPAPEAYALPTEIWREVVARRQRYEELRLKLAGGEVHEANDLITYNLDIRQFVQDVAETSEGPDLVYALWKALLKIKILDPTCGSGAFLFAALNILEPLYEACLERMDGFLQEWQQASTNRHPNYTREFGQVLAEVDRHANRRYYILKTIIVHNLYGVDIMDEAVEICKLRLFLKLVAQVEKTEQIEPLPDIDFNIRAGNTLVGFTKLEEVQKALTIRPNGQLVMQDAATSAQLRRIEEDAEAADLEYKQYQDQQLKQNYMTAADKAALNTRLAKLNDELNQALARTYGIEPEGTAYTAWLRNHKPFHWWANFFGIMQAGGFDVIIGNPPYVSYSPKGSPYQIIGYQSLPCGNLWALCIERSLSILAHEGRTSMIVQLSLTFSRDFTEVRKLLLDTKGFLSISNYDNIPDRLFTGEKQSDNTSKQNQQRITIYILHTKPLAKQSIIMSPLVRWRAEERDRLLVQLPQTEMADFCTPNCFPKVGTTNMRDFLRRWQRCSHTLEALIDANGSFPLVVPKTAGYYVAAYESALARTEQMGLLFRTEDDRDLALLMINSNCFFWRWRTYGDGFHVTKGDIMECPLPIPDDQEYRKIAALLRGAFPACTVYKGYLGKQVPNVNFNLRMDLLWKADNWLIRHIAPDLGLTPVDFTWAKSNSFLHLHVPKSACWPEEHQYMNDISEDHEQ